ncbi:ArsR/SmtB family transcription factor [Streptomyces sp. NPDC017979]|uniref:ArsR/SmtB family transcription factor n=1 Tax=Streptomyces sp. NPDC017979 TaxID=3365024 RepID=UPI0037B2D639
MLRFHFTPEDLARTRVVATWGPLGETFFSLMTLQQSHMGSAFAGWRERLFDDPLAHRTLRNPATTLFRGGVLDLFTLTGHAATLDQGLEALVSARPRHFAAELADAEESHAFYFPAASSWAGARWGDPARERGDRNDLVNFLREYHDTAVLPYWKRMHARLAAEQAALARTLAERGIDAMLASLPAGFRWRPPVLEVGRGPVTGESRLGGRGMMLVPSIFCQNRPTSYVSASDEQIPVLLFVPLVRNVSDTARVLADDTAELAALEALLGRTRARALDAIGRGPCTTGQLAERLSVSLPNASEHATILRNAGVISTTRHGSAVLHTLTALGTTLLNGG